jgi:hypothetical protein
MPCLTSNGPLISRGTLSGLSMQTRVSVRCGVVLLLPPTLLWCSLIIGDCNTCLHLWQSVCVCATQARQGARERPAVLEGDLALLQLLLLS